MAKKKQTGEKKPVAAKTDAAKQPKAETALDARVRRLEGQGRIMDNTVGRIVRALERVFGVDIDKDGKVGGARVAALAALFLVCGLVVTFIVADPPAASIFPIRDDFYFTTNTVYAPDIVVADDLTVGDDFTVTGDQTVSGAMTVTGVLTASSNLAVTLNQTVGGTLTATGDVAADSNLTVAVNATVTGATDLNGATTATNITLDAGATLAGDIITEAAGAAGVKVMDVTINDDDISAGVSGVLGIGTIEVGHASDTTVSRVSAGDINIEGNIAYRAGGTDVPVADGGTGVGTLTDHCVIVGSGTGAVTVLSVGADDQVLRGSTGADPAFGALDDGDIPDSHSHTADSIGALEVDSGTEVATFTVAAVAGTNYVGAMQTSLITFTNVVETFTDGSDEGESQLLMTFPEGSILIVSVWLDTTISCTTNVFEDSTDDVFFTAIGTAPAGDDATLAGTEQDIISVATHDTVAAGGDGGTVFSFEWEDRLTAGADSVWDGTSTAVKLYFNTCVADTSISADTSVTNIGAMRVHWILEGNK